MTFELLLEREAEQDALTDVLGRAVEGEGQLVAVVGAPGIGKTSLLAALAETAVARGATVLRARGSELDRSFGLGVARQLFERRLQGPDREDLLKGAARHALGALGVEVDATHATEAGAQALHGLYWLTANLAACGPLVVCVDDAHWADRASLRSLVYTARRLAGLRVMLLATFRPLEPGADQALLDALQAEAALTVRPGDLSASATGSVLAHEIGAEPDAAFVAASWRATGGNPLLVGELARQCARDGIAPSAEAAGAVAQVSAEGVAQAVRLRVQALDAPALDVMRSVAVLGDGATVPEVVRLTELPEPAIRRAAEDLAAVHVLAPGRVLGFVHPLIRTAAYQSIPEMRRASMHRAAAVMLDDAGAEPESIARHLLLVEPRADPRAARTLLTAGRNAARRGAPDAALTYLERAEQEPPPPELRVEILVALGTAGARLRAPGFETYLQEAIAATADATTAARIALLLVEAQFASGRQVDAPIVLDAAYERVDPDSPVALMIEAVATAQYQYMPALWPDVWQARAQRRLAQFEAGERLDPIALCGLVGYAQRLPPPASRSSAVVDGALAALDVLLERGGVLSGSLIASVAFGVANLGRLREAGAVFDAAVETGRRDGAVISMCWALGMRGEISYREGRLVDAESELREAYGLLQMDDGIGATPLTWISGITAIVLTERGHAEEAAAVLAALADHVWTRPTLLTGLMLTARAAVRGALGDSEGAIADLQETGRRVEGLWANPVVTRWRAPAALLLAGRGARDQALVLAREDLALAEAYDLPIAIGVARAACGVAAGGDAGLAHLRAAADGLAGTEARLEHARAVVELGAALRRTGTPAAAREPLRVGLDLATRCGAVHLAGRAREELVAAGARPRRDRRLLSGPEALTPSEHRVAKLAAGGITNREIAERLYVTQAAVQWHLRNVFRKLDIASRTALAGALDPPAEAKPYGVLASDEDDVQT